jgi:methionine synthase I (cobalamin-dependent)/5,10-methylenetetrahydrofolate reductase
MVEVREGSMRGKELLARMRQEVVIGDGALGTMFAEHGLGRDVVYERLNRTQPEMVRGIHAAYVEAGSQLIETNTFGANRIRLGQLEGPDEVATLNALGVQLAREAAGERAVVAGSVGPLTTPRGPQAFLTLSDDEIRDIFREQILALANAGADLILLETFTDLRQLLLALGVVKAETDLPAICQMAFHERGHTQSGVSVVQALQALQAAGADVVGANCGRGVRCVVDAAQTLTRLSDGLVSAFPNAGLPQYVDGRYLFGAPLPYLVHSAEELAGLGVNLIGGCCGTTPDYIRRVAQVLRGRSLSVRVSISIEPPPVIEVKPAAGEQLPAPSLEPPPGSILHNRRDATGERRPLVVAEIDPPRGLVYENIVRRCKQLRDMGIDAITMADNPVATLHMGNLALAKIVQDEADVPVVLHLAGRDHNLLGVQSRLMEAHTLGIHHILALTGDPAKVGDCPGATSVYDLNSFGLVELLHRFNCGVTQSGAPLGRSTRFTIGVALNPNTANIAGQVQRLMKKVALGAHFAMTQPIYDPARFEKMMDAVAPSGVPVLVGIMPLLSERNAEFLHNEVPGIVLTDEVRRRMRGLSGKEGRRVGMAICYELIDAMLPRADGFYLIPPQKFTELAADLVAYINSKVSERRKTG